MSWHMPRICKKTKVASTSHSVACRTRALTVPLFWALLRPNLKSSGHLWDPHDKKDFEGLECVHKREQSWGRGWRTRSS